MVMKALDEGLSEASGYLASLSPDAAGAPWRLTLRGAEVFSMPRAVMLRSLLLNHWYHHRGQLSVYLRLLDVPIPVIYDAVRTRIPSPDGGAKLNNRGIRCPSRRPHTVDSQERRRILRKEDVRRTRVYGQRPHVLRRSENGPGITADAGRSRRILSPTSYQTNGLHRQANEIDDLRQRDRHRLR